MSKKTAQNTIDVKINEINRIVSDTLNGLSTKMQTATNQLTEQVTKEVNTMVTNLTKEIETKVNELKGQTMTVSPQQMQQMQQSAEDNLPGGKGHK